MKKGLDNSDNNNILNNRKGNNTINKQKEGDKDGRQQSNKQQSNSDKERRRQELRRAIKRIYERLDSGRHDGFISKPYEKRSGNGLANGLVEYSIEAKPEIKSIFESVGVPTPAFNQLKKNNEQSIDTFKNAIAKAKQSLGDNGASVELKDDYTDINLYLSEDGESGFGIKPNGDIVSVFSSSKEKGRSSYMLEMAKSQGGRQLDCFDIYLTKIYEAHGFKPVAKMKWNDEYIPDGWNKDNFKDYNNGEPALTAGRRHVVFMVYDPENEIERKHKEHWNKYGDKYGDTEERNIPYVPEYDDGETFQHIHKWRSPAEREAIYNNMLERYKNAKTSEELKKTVFDNDAPLDVFNRLFDDLNSLNKEQAQGIKDEYDKRMLELLKEEDPEEYKAHKKYLEQKAKKNKQKADAKIDLQTYIDNAIETPFINDLLILADAKREFDESKVKRDKDGRFAKKNGNKDTKDNDKIKDTDNDNDNRTVEQRINQLPEHLQETAKKLYNNNPIPSDLIIKDDASYNTDNVLAYIDEEMIDEEKYSKLNEMETLLNSFTENAQSTRDSKTFKRLKKDLVKLIENAPPVKQPYRVEYMIKGRDNLAIGTKVNFDIRSFADFGAGEKTANKISNYLRDEVVDPSKLVIYVIDDEVNGLDITTLSSYPNQNECLINGDFIISEVEEGDEYNPHIVHLKRYKK